MDEGAKLRTIGKYHLIASLGQGGMAKVYLALLAGPAGFNKLLVIKVLRDDVLGSEEGVRMFWDEARLAARLVHPNIVHTFEVGEADGRYFLAMEYLEGQTYREVQTRARANGSLPLADEIRILSEIARGLHYSHELKGFNGEPLGVVHRDVSPQNVFLTYDGQVKLLDFGIAKTADAEHLTQVGVIKGKLDYIAPEQLKGENIDGRADVFALGAMLWEAITGQRFAGGRKVTDVTKVHLRLSGGEPKLRDVKPDVPEELARIVDKAIAIEADDRFEDAAAFADALDGYLASVGAKPNGKTLAAVMAPLFDQERQAMHKLVDEQVKLTKSGVVQLSENTGDLPQLGKAQQNSTSGVYLGGEGADTSGHNVAAPHDTSAGARASGARSRGLVIALFAVAGGVLGAVQFMKNDAPPPSSVTANSPAAQPSTPVSTAPSALAPAVQPSDEAPAEATVTVTIKAEPPNAQVTLDGAQIPAPFNGEFRKSSSLHHVEATADGYRSYKRLITFEEDRLIEIVLEKAPQPQVARRGGRNDAQDKKQPEPQAPREEPKVTPPPQPTVDKNAGPLGEPPVKSRVKRGDIDLSDPYSTN